MIRNHTNKPSLRKQLSHRFESIQKKAIKESAIDDLFDEWLETIEFDDIRGLMPSRLSEYVKDIVDENTSDRKVLRTIKNDADSWLDGDDRVINYCISLLKEYLKEEKDELDPDEFEDEKELNDYFEDEHKEEIDQLKDLENEALDGDDMMDIIYNYGDEDKLVDWMRDDVIDYIARDMSWDEQIEMLGLDSLSGKDLADALVSLDIISMKRLFEEFRLISENDEYWYYRKIELEDDEDEDDDDDDMDESSHRRHHKHHITEKHNRLYRKSENKNKKQKSYKLENILVPEKRSFRMKRPK